MLYGCCVCVVDLVPVPGPRLVCCMSEITVELLCSNVNGQGDSTDSAGASSGGSRTLAYVGPYLRNGNVT